MSPLRLYRGIDVNNNEFVYGYLTVDPLSNEYVIQETDGLGWGAQYEVDQQSIDICIGDDTDGNHIFENDIVRILYTDWTSQDNWIECMIRYNEKDKQFEGVSIKPNKYGDYETWSLNPGKFGWMRVVGNKYNL